MDEATKQALNAFVQQMITAAQDSAKWTTEQAPLVVQEWLQWRLAEHVITAVALVVLLVAVWRLSKHLIVMRVDIDGDPIPLFVGWLLRVAAGGFLGAALFSNVLSAAKVYLAPRVVVLEQFISLVK